MRYIHTVIHVAGWQLDNNIIGFYTAREAYVRSTRGGTFTIDCVTM